ncbi:MAG: MarR family transcriptional regulator [Nitrospirae bacterium]|jgi:DNA-binding MarR family transcriptional regulator|nr:MarR family transcriptional regulator [Nitrospirota bacterium]
MEDLRKNGAEPASRDDYPPRIKLMKLFWMLGPAFVRWAESQMEQDGYTPQRMYLLGTLYEYGPMMMSALKDRLGVTATNITSHVDALEREGMVERVPLPSDRRVTIVSLTSRAEETLQKLCSPFMHRVSSIFDSFTPEEQETLFSCLLRMRAFLVEHKILDEKSRTFGRPEDTAQSLAGKD